MDTRESQKEMLWKIRKNKKQFYWERKKHYGRNVCYGHWTKVTFSQVVVTGGGHRVWVEGFRYEKGMSKGIRYGSRIKASRNKAIARELERGKMSRWRAKRSLLKDKMATLTNCSPLIMNWAEDSSRILWCCFQFLWNANMNMARYIPRCPWRS